MHKFHSVIIQCTEWSSGAEELRRKKKLDKPKRRKEVRRLQICQVKSEQVEMNMRSVKKFDTINHFST